MRHIGTCTDSHYGYNGVRQEAPRREFICSWGLPARLRSLARALISARGQPLSQLRSFFIAWPSVFCPLASCTHRASTPGPPQSDSTFATSTLQTPEEQQRRAARSKVKYPGPKPKVVTAKAGGKPVPHPPVLRQVAQAQKGPQTLVQPDLHSELTLATGSACSLARHLVSAKRARENHRRAPA